MPPPSSPVPRLSSVPSAVLTVHTIASRSPLRHHRTSNQDERKGGHPVRFWAMSSPHLATTSTPIDSDQQQGSASPRLPSCPLRPLPRPLPLCQVVRVWRRASQGGRSPASHPAAPLHPAGVPRHICGHLRRGAGSGQPYQGGGADLRESLFRDFLRGCIALNINYLFSPSGRVVQCQYIGGMVIVLKVKNITI